MTVTSNALSVLRTLWLGFKQPRPAIAMYHRINRLAYDPWGLAVHPEHFESHLHLFGRTRTVMDLGSFVRLASCGSLPNNALAITFDDGYVDNLTYAEPRLRDAGLPATLFLATSTIGASVQFWWDELTQLILERRSEADLEVRLNEQSYPIKFRAMAEGDAGEGTWRAWMPCVTPRQATYMALWSYLRVASSEDRERVISDIRAYLGEHQHSERDRALSKEEIQEIARRGQFTFGGHTNTHPALTSLTPEQRRSEVVLGKSIVESMIGCRLSGFAYPFGDMDAGVKETVRSCGFEWACSTRAAAVCPGFDAFDLPRIAIPNASADALARMFARL